MVHLGSLIQSTLSKFPKTWDGKEYIVQMRKEGSNYWRQMGWIGWYFQHLCDTRLNKVFQIPGESFRNGNVSFDGAVEGLDFDFKANAWLTASGKRQPNTALNSDNDGGSQLRQLSKRPDHLRRRSVACPDCDTRFVKKTPFGCIDYSRSFTFLNRAAE